MVALDPRLMDTRLLVLAAMRVRQRQTTAPRQRVSLQILLSDALGHEQGAVYSGPTYERVEGR